ncbi:MAG TPA: GAF domain-containing protein [Anaerolineales bacterium]|nr:GAF domain-containing protein [Anaerolineales bacterium]
MTRLSLSSSVRSNTSINQALQAVAFVYQFLAVATFIAAFFLANWWMSFPFLGAFYEHTMVFNGVVPTGTDASWDLNNQGVKLGDQLISVNGQAVHNTFDVQNILAGFHPGDQIPVIVRSADGGQKTYDVTLHAFTTQNRVQYFIIPIFLSLIFLVISLWIFVIRRTESAGRAFALFASSLSIGAGSLFDLYTTHALTYLWTLSLPVAGGALIDLALAFPQEASFVAGRSYLRRVGYAVSFLLCVYAYTTLFNFSHPTNYIQAWQYIYVYLGLSSLVYILFNVYYSFAAPSPVIKAQARMILTGTIIAFGPITIWFLTTPFHVFGFTPYLLIPIVIFPLTLGYAILRFRFLRTDDWMRQGMIYALLTIFIVGGYALLVSGLSLIFRAAMPASNPIWVGGLVFVIAIFLDPVRIRTQSVVDATLFRGRRAYAENIQNFGHELHSALDLSTIGRTLRKQINSTLGPDRLHIYVYDLLNDQYTALPIEDGRASTDIRFSASSALAQYFVSEQLPLYLDETSLPESLRTEQTRLTLLGARLFVALPGRGQATGWLALGARLNGQPYTPRDLVFLENLCDQASIAIQRIQTVANLERRVQEMNALTRVSQGVNVTLTFDDVLELIYAQTAQIIPTSHLHITLYNKTNNYFYYGFCVENGDRIASRENVPYPPNTGLNPEITRRGRPILTQDYMRECQARNLAPETEGVFAWMGVPLNAGAESIGALSVGSRDPGVAYTRGQLDLLQAIADQTAGAIVKARLLQETQQRARQLGTLNDVTRQLTSTLEIDPLLRNVLESAVNILNCEAGSLFLVDDQTRELVFRVTVGPVAKDLLGQRLPAGSGIVGRAVATRGPVIENDVKHSSGWSPNTDERTGFTTRALMAVPLQIRDNVMGVIEVINRRDGLPFVDEDQALLTAFAGQAAVALENARLFTLTDQELATRVEELSVMQRIDRELNASLELDRAMRITLEWAMRQSGADAGLIGMIEENKLHIVAQQGYEERLAEFQNQLMPLDLPVLKTAVETNQPQRITLDAKSTDGLLPGAHTQIVITIRREAAVIGLVLLESTSDTQQDIAFLNRLSDHAAIAISNAQLYDEVQRANLAKSEFVSFVAHELKNPMTSIKGYTELIAAGAVGQINEMQTNFLNTIRSNVERMSTLVSDLNDNSKIEAGRLRLDYKAVEVTELVDEVVRSTKRQVEDKKQSINVDMPPNLPKVWGDRTRLGQVLTNLVSNANKYTPEGGALLMGAELSGNRWDLEGAPQVIHLWVKDNGIGISPEDQQKIFQKFFRSEDQKAREAPGTGLGLNITKSLVEMQGGRIWFESEFRQGTTFHFTVPVAEGSAEHMSLIIKDQTL